MGGDATERGQAQGDWMCHTVLSTTERTPIEMENVGKVAAGFLKDLAAALQVTND